MNHLARLVERCGNCAETAEHALLAEFSVEHVEVQHAVEQRNDRGLRSDGGRKGFDRIVEIERLAAEQHDIEFLGELVGLHRRRVLQRHVAVRALDHEARTGEFGGALRADQKRHVAPGLKQPAAKISADSAGTDHENAHCLAPVQIQLRHART